MDRNDFYADFEERLVGWIASRSDVRDVVVVGSRAVLHPPADAWADLDLIFLVASPAVFVEDPAWPSGLGEVWFSVYHETFAGDPEWMAWFAPGIKVDLTVAHAGAGLDELLVTSPYADIFARGYRLIGVSEDRGLSKGPPTAEQPAPAPSQAAFAAACSAVLHLAGKTALLLGRGDLWRAKLLCDGELKSQLAVLIGWHASYHNTGGTVWESSRDLERWADPAGVKALERTFSAYDQGDLWRALFATLALYARLRSEIAASRSWPGPPAGEQAFLAWLRTLAPGD